MRYERRRQVMKWHKQGLYRKTIHRLRTYLKLNLWLTRLTTQSFCYLLFFYMLLLSACFLQNAGHERLQISFQFKNLEGDQVHKDKVPPNSVVSGGGRQQHNPPSWRRVPHGWLLYICFKALTMKGSTLLLNVLTWKGTKCMKTRSPLGCVVLEGGRQPHDLNILREDAPRFIVV